jgi:drug/metabolite transporter (DMT)-like permease
MNALQAITRHPRSSALVGALSIAFSGVLFRFSGVSPETGTVFRCLYALPWLGALVVLEARSFGRQAVPPLRLGILAGAFFGADLLFWQHSIVAVGVGLATVLANLQVLVVGAVSWALFGERPNRSTAIALPVMLVGVVLISGIVGGGAYGADPALGVVFGALSAIAYAGYLVVMRHVMRDGRPPATPLFVSTMTTMVVGLVAGIAIGSFDPVPTWPAHGWLAIVGFTSQAAGYLLVSVSPPRLPGVITSLILLTQPVTTIVLGALLLGESPSGFQLSGVALLIGGLAIANLGVAAKPARSSPAQESAGA